MASDGLGYFLHGLSADAFAGDVFAGLIAGVSVMFLAGPG